MPSSVPSPVAARPSLSLLAMERELAELHIIAGELAAGVEKDAGPWLQLLPELRQNTLATDIALKRAHGELRTLFLREVGLITSQHWRTPPTGQRVRFPGTSLNYDYAYDRQHPPLAIEARLQHQDPADENRNKGVIACSSGMSALLVTLLSLGFLDAQQPTIGVLAGYFETLTLLRLSPFAGAWQRVASAEALAEGIRQRRHRVIFIEPVQYDWKLGVVNWAPVLEAINDADDPPVVVIDTTLSGTSAQWLSVRRELLRSRTPLLICVRSGLKLDQEGLELANLGIIESWELSDEVSAPRFQQTASACRVVTGSGIGWPEACCLSPGFVLDPTRTDAYCANVFQTNRAMFKEVVMSGTLFTSAVHPPSPWGAPFVLYQLREGDAAAYKQLAYLLHSEAERRSMDWAMSGSFGFRTDRYETILPSEQSRCGEDPGGVLKVAAGSYQGARFQHIVDLLNELASFHSLDEVRRVWSSRTITVPT